MIRFAYGALGKPSMPDRPELMFNVSHSANVIVIACTTSGAIGVDVEQRRGLNDEAELVERFFQRVEVSEYAALPPSLRTAGFYNGWTRKEAILKARGDGLSTPLDSFSVCLDPREPCRIREFLTLPERLDDWSLIAFEPAPQCTAAVAVRARGVRLMQFRVNPDFLEAPVAAPLAQSPAVHEAPGNPPNPSP
jgi:4'-phosphopantetheinyl transferase